MSLTTREVNMYPQTAAGLSCEVMDIREFGRQLIETHDLDPVYSAIVGAKLPQDQLHRLLLAYWCFYHLGAAAWLSEREGEEFWTLAQIAARNETSPTQWGLVGDRWPRAAERRHFRGPKCLAAVCWLREHDALGRIGYLSRTCTGAVQLMRVIQTWPQFGPWIAFKAADMLERVAGVPLTFPRDLGLMYAEPREGLNMLMTPGQPGRPISTAQSPQDWWNMLLAHFSSLRAPPAGDRFCGPQEVETVLCKWKSHARGHYQVGKDIREVRHALEGWGDTARRLLACAPREVG